MEQRPARSFATADALAVILPPPFVDMFHRAQHFDEPCQVLGPRQARALLLPTLRNSSTRRKASFTALSLRKALRISGSSRTRFVPAW